MKSIFSSAVVVLLYGCHFDVTHAQTPCLNQWCVGSAACNYNSLIAALTAQLSASGCTHSALTELKLIFGVSTSQEVKEAIANVCAQSYENFEEITDSGKIFDKEFFDGGTYWNEEREWVTPALIVQDQLAVDPGTQIVQFYNGIAQSKGVKWPDKMDNFKDGCKLGAAMCCWVQDRQAGDNNGNCATPYDTNCHDADPADNVDVCYVDMQRAPTSSRTPQGFALFDQNTEGDSHCHGFAWSGLDPTHQSAKFKANNLFYVSMYDHLYKRGYVRNVPGAPMCACVEQMAVVDRSDCTEIAAREGLVKFCYNGSIVQAFASGVSIQFNACQGLDGTNNDLDAYYRRLVKEGHRSDIEYKEFIKTVVGKGNCAAASSVFMKSKGFSYGAVLKVPYEEPLPYDPVNDYY